MTRHFSSDLAVLPFVVAPIAQIGSEASFLFGPLRLTRHGEALRVLLDESADGGERLSPFLAQVRFLEGRILASVKIKTAVPDVRSGRLGLNLILGVWISPSVFLLQASVFLRSFLLLDGFVQSCVGKSLSESGSEELVRLLQGLQINLDQQLSELPTVLGRYEGAFCTSYKEESSLLQKIRLALFLRKIFGGIRIRPAQHFEDIVNYWKYLDLRVDSALGRLEGLLQVPLS